MTQTNTTQNKEELIEREFKKRIVGVLSDIKNSFLPTDAGYIIIKNIFKEELDKSLSQAHQSGIEEERKRIVEIIDAKKIDLKPIEEEIKKDHWLAKEQAKKTSKEKQWSREKWQLWIENFDRKQGKHLIRIRTAINTKNKFIRKLIKSLKENKQ